MSRSFYPVNKVLGWKLRTLDGATAGLRDMLIDTERWMVRFLTADADAWAPDREVLVATLSVTGLDESRAELGLELDADTLRASPLVMIGDGIAGFGDEDALPAGWEEHWRAEVDPEEGVDAPPPPSEDLEAAVAPDLSVETSLSADELIRAETLRGWTGETTDGVVVQIQDLVIDDTDWSLAYVDVAISGEGGAAPDDLARRTTTTQCLVPSQALDWLNRGAETLHLAVLASELRDAALEPSPVAFDDRRAVRVLGVD